ncbi:MAG: hypothetical protein MJA27_14510 [Pseudanabaenales cyanobacterium]|nr:hypothetical protein [Pseudanabaenales cyanobacterium]
MALFKEMPMLVQENHRRSVVDLGCSRFGHEAIVTDVLQQGGEWRVRFQGSYWHAWCMQSMVELQSNQRVSVVGRYNNVLLIQPISSS